MQGIEKEVLLDRKVRCKTCAGSRCAPNTFPARCWTCYGKGIRVFKNGPFVEEDMCTPCGGTGAEVRFPCPVCKGRGVTTEKVLDRLRVEPFSDRRDTIEFEKKGHECPSGLRGSVIVTMNICDRGSLVRENLDIIGDAEIPVWKAVLGGDVVVRTLQGDRAIRLSSATHAQVVEIKEAGARCPATGKVGDHYAHIVIRSAQGSSEAEAEVYRLLSTLEHLQNPNEGDASVKR